MKKTVLFSIVLLIAGGIALSQTTAAQIQGQEQGNPPGLQNDNARCVKIAVINSQRALEQSTEGKKLLEKAGQLSKKKAEEELQRIRTEMVEVVRKLAKEKGYGLVLDLNTSGIICFLAPVDDLTDALVERYNSLIR